MRFWDPDGEKRRKDRDSIERSGHAIGRLAAINARFRNPPVKYQDTQRFRLLTTEQLNQQLREAEEAQQAAEAEAARRAAEAAAAAGLYDQDNPPLPNEPQSDASQHRLPPESSDNNVQ